MFPDVGKDLLYVPHVFPDDLLVPDGEIFSGIAEQIMIFRQGKERVQCGVLPYEVLGELLSRLIGRAPKPGMFQAVQDFIIKMGYSAPLDEPDVCQPPGLEKNRRNVEPAIRIP
ncbi:MAG: hypothetical protein WCC06_10675 [Candidatus Aminicenantales bacterium]